MKKILYIASEFATGMIPFAAKVISTMNQDCRYEVYAVVVNSGQYSYTGLIQGMDERHLVQIEYPKNKLLKLLYKFYPFPIIKTLRRLERSIKPDIIHLLTGDFTLAPYVMLWNFKSKNNIYYTVHDLHPHEVNKSSIIHNLLHKYINWGYKRLCDLAQHLTTSSFAQYEELKHIYPNKNIEFTHFPSLVTPQIIRGEKRVPELIGEVGYILFFGSVDKYKGTDLLIDAYKKSQIYGNLKLVIAGKGKETATDKIEDPYIIRINRFIEDIEVKDLFSKALFVVYPYRSATMSGVLSIAYYFKKKVLLSSIPFFKENASSLTSFFECGSCEDLCFQLEKLYKTSQIDEVQKDCYEMIYSDIVLKNDYHRLYIHS